MNVVAIVANMQKELDYYKEVAAEMRAIIKQMSGQPPDGFEYIHPYDFAELINATDVSHVDVYAYSTGRRTASGNGIVTIDNKKYKQSPYIPAKSKKFS